MFRRLLPYYIIVAVIAVLAVLEVGLAVHGSPSGSAQQVAQYGPGDALAPTRDAARVYPLAARFPPGQEAAIRVEALSPTGASLTGPLQLNVFHLGDEVYRATSDEVTLMPNTPTTVEFKWMPQPTDFTGYLAVVSAGGRVIGSTGIDVSSTSLAYPRYSYVSEFLPTNDPGSPDQTVRLLAQDYHQNMFQLYDWFWRHEKLIERQDGNLPDSWRDLFGRTNSVPVIRGIIDAAHRYNALAMAYVMIYAAREGYAERWPISPSWGIFANQQASEQVSLDFSAISPGTRLFLFDPGNPGWQGWMANEYKDAIDTFGFNGVHIDQIGPRYGVFRADGSPLDLPSSFPRFLDAIDEALSSHGPAACTFNIVDGTVDGWAVKETATNEACDFLYSEIWYKTNTYAELRDYITQLRQIGRGRQVVLAAYPQYGEEVGPIFEAEGDTELNGAGTASNEVGYTGVGFVDSFDNRGDSITWDINLAEPSTESLVFRYANASGHAVTAHLYVNNNLAGDVHFGTRSTWTAWTTDAYLQTQLNGGANTIRLALDDDTDGAVLVDHLSLGQFDEDAVRLQLASTFASGATSIIIGDNEQSLAHEYYPNRSKAIPPPLKRALRDYFSFITAYESILFPPEVVPIDDPGTKLVATTGHKLIDQGAGGIWVVPRRIGPYDTLNLVNLVTLDDLWRNAADRPPPQTDVGLRYYAGDTPVESVSLASPDFDFGRPASLPFTTGRDDRGAYIEFTVPRLNYWDMVYVRHSQ